MLTSRFYVKINMTEARVLHMNTYTFSRGFDKHH